MSSSSPQAPSADGFPPGLIISLQTPDFTSLHARARWDAFYKGFEAYAPPELTLDALTPAEIDVPTVATTPESPTSSSSESSPTMRYYHSGWQPETDVERETTSSDGRSHGFRIPIVRTSHQVMNMSKGAGVHVIASTTGGGVLPTRQVYTICLDVLQNNLPPEARRLLGDGPTTTEIDFIFDNGSNNTWSFGHMYKELRISEESGAQPQSASLPPIPWTAVLYKHPKGGFWDNAKDMFVSGEAVYASGTRAKLTMSLAPTCIQINCFAWGKFRTPVARDLDLHIGVAYKVDKGFSREPGMYGILGAGPSRTQPGCRSKKTFPSFIEALKGYVPKDTSRTRDPQTSIYIVLPPPTNADPKPESWLAFNVWPCGTAPEWSHKITHPSGLDLNPSTWAFRLRSLQFECTMTPGSVPQSMGTIPFPGGLYVNVDTGSSANWVPANFVASLRSIFRNSFNREIDQAVPGTLLRLPGGDKACEYLIDHDVSNWQVLLEVDGEGDNRVMLTCPLDPFICSSKNRVKAEDGFKMPGTFYTLPQAWKPPGDAIFGLSFFHSQFVSLHWPDGNGTPYMKMATQHAHLKDSYKLPAEV